MIIIYTYNLLKVLKYKCFNCGVYKYDNGYTLYILLSPRYKLCRFGNFVFWIDGIINENLL
jgi:hypothetical protein